MHSDWTNFTCRCTSLPILNKTESEVFEEKLIRKWNDDENKILHTPVQPREGQLYQEEPKTVVTCKIKNLQNICKNVLVFYFTCNYP